jgi:hypothetical protein
MELAGFMDNPGTKKQEKGGVNGEVCGNGLF